MTERVLSTAELNRALLARQFLLDRSRLSLPRTIERIGGLQTQYSPSGYIGLWSRLRGFRRADLTKALEQRRVIQATLMRSTIHMVSARDYPVLLAGVRRGRRDWWMRSQRSQMEGVDLTRAARLVRLHLSEGPRRQPDLVEILLAEGFPRIAWPAMSMWLDMVRVPPSGTWERRRADLYGLAEEWVGPVRATEDEGVELLIRRYLGGFGPASVADAANWAGLTVGTVRPVAERLGLRRFRDEKGSELLDLPRAPIPSADTAAPVRFLPTWDATLLVHARRTQVLPERFRELVFNTKTPHSLATFLVDGAVAGWWRYEKGRVNVEPFEPLPRGPRRAVEEEAALLSAFHADAT